MEKRTIIAFALSFLVLVGWFYFQSLFMPKEEQAPSRKRDAYERGETTLSESAEPSITKPAVPPVTEKERGKKTVAPEIKEKKIKVETPLYTAIFSNQGAVIKSFRLREYHLTTAPDSPMIELVSLEKSGEDFFEINFDHQSNPKNKKIFYKVNEESIRLDPESSPRDLTFSAMTADGVSINQTLRFYPDRYDIDLQITLVNNSEKQVKGYLKAHLKNLPPKEKKSYYAFVGIALLLNDKLEQIKPKDMDSDTIKKLALPGRIDWMAYEDDYFMTAIIPDDQRDEDDFEGRLLPSGVLKATYLTPPIVLKSFEQVSSRFTLYLGPRDLYVLKTLNKKLEKAIDYGFFNVIAKPLLYTLRFFNQYVHNYGVSIILLTVLIKILFWPLTHKSYKSMKEMQKLQPLMAKIREKYKNNKEQMNKELMGLYKTYKVNPMGGCLPMVIQLPVFFALFRILGNSIELRHTPFVLWINDLSAPDRLFNFPFQIPFMSPPYGIPILTLLMGASMFIQQKMTPTPGDPAQAKIMMFLPIVFTFMFINFPSGLVLYWLTNNILSIGQQYGIKKRPA